MKKGKSPRINKKIILIAVFVVILLPLAAYLGRGWIRTTFVPKGTQIFYSRSLNNKLGDEKPAINQTINQLGIEYKKTASARCSLSYAKKFSVATLCLSDTYEGELFITSENRKQWNDNTENADKSLKSAGWSIFDVGLDKLATTQDDYQNYYSVLYRKDSGSIKCSLGFYTDPQEVNRSRIHSYYECIRTLGNDPRTGG